MIPSPAMLVRGYCCLKTATSALALRRVTTGCNGDNGTQLLFAVSLRHQNLGQAFRRARHGRPCPGRSTPWAREIRGSPGSLAMTDEAAALRARPLPLSTVVAVISHRDHDATARHRQAASNPPDGSISPATKAERHAEAIRQRLLAAAHSRRAAGAVVLVRISREMHRAQRREMQRGRRSDAASTASGV